MKLININSEQPLSVRKIIAKICLCLMVVLTIAIAPALLFVSPEALAVDYNKQTLMEHDFSDRDLTDASFDHTNLRGSDFSHTNISGCALFWS